MQRYTKICDLGDGSFGEVSKAKVAATGDIVAIKKMKKKYRSWEECKQLRELKSLSKLKNHPNIVKLKEVIRERDELFFVFEFMDGNLHNHIQHQKHHFSEDEVRTVVYQLVSGLAYMHKHGFFHRDIKPENLLMKDGVIKIADLGLARETRSRPPYTDYVSTRWYRAPELLLRSPCYSSPIDAWAVGCILAEMLLLRTLFPGSSETDQLYRIFTLLGPPMSSGSVNVWPEGVNLATTANYRPPPQQKKMDPIAALQQQMPHAGSAALQLCADLLQYDPQARPTMSQALNSPFLLPLHRQQQQQQQQQIGRGDTSPFPTLTTPRPDSQQKPHHQQQQQQQQQQRGSVGSVGSSGRDEESSGGTGVGTAKRTGAGSTAGAPGGGAGGGGGQPWERDLEWEKQWERENGGGLEGMGGGGGGIW